LIPIYEELAKSKENLNWAKTIYSEAKENYHFVSKQSIAEMLKIN
jgi:hypothetical protein